MELPLVDPHSKEPIRPDFLKRFGTRHNSAVAYCRTHPGAIAFAVSHDGDLRVVASDHRYVYFDDRVSPAERWGDMI